MSEIRHWLVKTEPDVFSIEDWGRATKRTTGWDGVRNYQARNFMRDLMKLGHEVLVHHSNADPSALVGWAKVVREAYPDLTALDASSPYFDPKATAADPRWVMVDLKLEGVFAEPLPLERLKQEKQLEGMELLRRGSRLSVQPVTAVQFRHIMKLAGVKKV